MVDPDAVRRYDEDAPSRSETETATFALGCFWGPDASFGATDGAVRTRVGYAGGTTADPTYHDIGDHSEAIQVDYDPSEPSFSDLVDAAVDAHDPRTQPRKRQYQNVLFHETPAERETIEGRLDERFDADAVATRVEPLEGFTVAESYHQKYRLRSKRAVLDAFETTGYDDAGIRESPAAAKLNARAAGHEVPAAARRL